MRLSDFSKHLSHFRLIIIDEVIVFSHEIPVLLVYILQIIIESCALLAELHVQLSNDRGGTNSILVSNQIANTVPNSLFIRKESLVSLLIQLNSFVANPFEPCENLLKMESFNFSHLLDEL